MLSMLASAYLGALIAPKYDEFLAFRTVRTLFETLCSRIVGLARVIARYRSIRTLNRRDNITFLSTKRIALRKNEYVTVKQMMV